MEDSVVKHAPEAVPVTGDGDADRYGAPQLVRSPELPGYLTYADYLRYEGEGFFELIRGRLLKMPSPLDRHQAAVGEIFRMAGNHMRSRPRERRCTVRVAPYDVRLWRAPDDEQGTVVQPDVCIICDRSKVERRGCHGAPDLIVEVLSDGTRQHDLLTKKILYEQAGVREYWTVDPQAFQIDQYLPSAQRGPNDEALYASPREHGLGATVASAAVPGWTVVVDEVFEELLG